MCFLHSIVKPIIDAWHILKSSYDETSQFFIVSPGELLNVCQAATQYVKKRILKILAENPFVLSFSRGPISQKTVF